jgi:osmoprotectant transport system permease protein
MTAPVECCWSTTMVGPRGSWSPPTSDRQCPPTRPEHPGVFVNWVANNISTITQRCVEHLALVLPPIALSFFLSVPLGWIASRLRAARGALLTTVGLLYAIPSLPLFIILPALLGTSLRDPKNVVVALTLYGIALMVQSATGAFGAVAEDVADAATAIGFGR